MIGWSRTEQLRLGKTREEAEAAYRAWLIEQQGQLPQGQQHNLTVAEIGQQFLNHCKLHTAEANCQYYRYFVRHLVAQFGCTPASAIIPRSFNQWLDARRHAAHDDLRRPAPHPPAHTIHFGRAAGRVIKFIGPLSSTLSALGSLARPSSSSGADGGP